MNMRITSLLGVAIRINLVAAVLAYAWAMFQFFTTFYTENFVDNDAFIVKLSSYYGLMLYLSLALILFLVSRERYEPHGRAA